MPEKFMKPYDPAATESRIYAAWEESGLFNPDECVKQGITPPDAPSYSIVLPPPNVTGRLHMGHALMLAVEDIFIRYKRMQGFRTLWVPGTDHAAIATQSVVEKQIKKDEDKNRHDLGREELLKRIEAFAAASHPFRMIKPPARTPPQNSTPPAMKKIFPSPSQPRAPKPRWAMSPWPCI